MEKATKMQHLSSFKRDDTLDDCRALDHKCPHENVARHDYYYLSDYYQLALAGPAVFVSKIHDQRCETLRSPDQCDDMHLTLKPEI